VSAPCSGTCCWRRCSTHRWCRARPPWYPHNREELGRADRIDAVARAQVRILVVLHRVRRVVAIGGIVGVVAKEVDRLLPFEIHDAQHLPGVRTLTSSGRVRPPRPARPCSPRWPPCKPARPARQTTDDPATRKCASRLYADFRPNSTESPLESGKAHNARCSWFKSSPRNNRNRSHKPRADHSQVYTYRCVDGDFRLCGGWI